jgi:hypothetical protein
LSQWVPVLGVALTKWNFPNNLTHKLFGVCTVDKQMVMVQGLPYASNSVSFIHSFIIGNCHHGRTNFECGRMFRVYCVFLIFHIEKPTMLIFFSNVNERRKEGKIMQRLKKGNKCSELQRHY